MESLQLDLTDEKFQKARRQIIGGLRCTVRPGYPWVALEDEEHGNYVLCIAHNKVRIILTDAQVEEFRHLFVSGERET